MNCVGGRRPAAEPLGQIGDITGLMLQQELIPPQHHVSQQRLHGTIVGPTNETIQPKLAYVDEGS